MRKALVYAFLRQGKSMQFYDITSLDFLLSQMVKVRSNWILQIEYVELTEREKIILSR